MTRFFPYLITALMALPHLATAQSPQDEAAARIAALGMSTTQQSADEDTDIGILGAPTTLPFAALDSRLTVSNCLLQISSHTTDWATNTPYVQARSTLNLRSLILAPDGTLPFHMSQNGPSPSAHFSFITDPRDGAERYYSPPGRYPMLRGFWLLTGTQTEYIRGTASFTLTGPDLDTRATALAQALVDYKTTYCPTSD